MVCPHATAWIICVWLMPILANSLLKASMVSCGCGTARYDAYVVASTRPGRIGIDGPPQARTEVYVPIAIMSAKEVRGPKKGSYVVRVVGNAEPIS